MSERPSGRGQLVGRINHRPSAYWQPQGPAGGPFRGPRNQLAHSGAKTPTIRGLQVQKATLAAGRPLNSKFQCTRLRRMPRSVDGARISADWGQAGALSLSVVH